MENKLLTAQQVADYLQMPISSLYDLTHRRAIPFIKLGGRLRFRLVEIDEWLESQIVTMERAPTPQETVSRCPRSGLAPKTRKEMTDASKCKSPGGGASCAA